MHAAALLLDMSERPAPVVSTIPYHQVRTGGHPLNRGVYVSSDRTLSGVGSFEVGCPLWIDDRGRVDNPGLIGLTEGSDVEVWRDGWLRICNGFVDKVVVDLSLGWVKLMCLDTTEDANRTNHGVGRGTGWTGPDATDPTVVGGWVAANAVITEGTEGPWGHSISVSYGSDPLNPWHFGAQARRVGPNGQLKGEVTIQPARNAPRPFVTMSERFLDKPAAAIDIPVSVPGPLASGHFCDPVPLPTVDGEPGRTALVDVACWSPMPGKGANKFALRLEVVAKDEATVAVPVGGGSADFVASCFNQAFSQSGARASATSTGGGLYFTDGMRIADDDTGTYGGHAGSYASSTEYRWNTDRGVVEVGGTGDLGVTRYDLRASNRAGARTPAIALSSASKGQASRVTVLGQEGDRSFAYTYVLNDGRWDRVVSVPSGAPVIAYATQEMAALGYPGRQETLIVQAPPGGRTAGDWLGQALDVGDRIPDTIDAGPFSQDTLQRITAMHHDGLSDAITVTVEPVP